MLIVLLLLLAAVAAAALALLWLVVRGHNKRLLLAGSHAVASDTPDGIGISVLCSGVRVQEQVENLLSAEYAHYEVIVVLDSLRYPVEFAAFTARYRMIRVEYVLSEELPVTGVRALGRSRKRCFRRLVLVDRVFDGAAGDLDAAAAVATYDYLLPVGRGQCLLPGTVERLVAELGSEPPGSLDLVRSHLGEPAVLLSREALVAAGGFGMRPLRGIPRSRRRTLWEPLLAPSEARRSLPRRWLFLPALLLAAAFGLSVAAGRWTAAAAVVTAALVWAAAACVSRAVSGEAWSGLRRFIPIRRIFRYY